MGVDRPDDLLDRGPEWQRLSRCARSSGPELCLLLGRRRAGKSFFLTRFVEAHGGIYHQATRKTEKEQLADLSATIGEHFDDPAFKRIAFPDWEALFGYVAERAGRDPLILVLDEFPYMADAAPALASILQREWDHTLPETRVKLVLAGSHVSAMRRLVEADQPLFGRRTCQLEFLPFNYADAAAFAPGYDSADRLRVYGMFGGLPGHLALVDSERPLGENVAQLLLDPTAPLYDEGAHVFDAFLGEAQVHYSVVAAIAEGETRWSKISNRVGRSSSSLLNPLTWLMEMDVVRQEAPITEFPNPSRKKMRYRLADPYLVFWHRFIADIRARGLGSLRDPAQLWRDHVAPRLDGYMGHVFEEAARTFVSHVAGPALPFRPIQVGAWWTDDGQEEVDVVALGAEGEVLIGEAKWGQVDDSDLSALERRAEMVVPQLKGVRSVRLAVFSGRGLTGSRIRRQVGEGRVLHYPIEAMYPGSRE